MATAMWLRGEGHSGKRARDGMTDKGQRSNGIEATMRVVMINSGHRGFVYRSVS